MTTIRTMMSLIIILLIGSIAYYHYSQQYTPDCTAESLRLYPVAIAYPGMSQTHAVYAVINHRRHACRIPRTPHFEPTQPSQRAHDDIVLHPTPNTQHLTWKDITWFSVHANSACSTILSTLPKIVPIYFSNGLVLQLPTVGYPCEPHVGKPLSTGLTDWTQAKQCHHSNSNHRIGKHVFLSDNLAINLGETLVCD